MGKQTKGADKAKREKAIEDGVAQFSLYVNTNTPYNGYICYVPPYNLGQVQYKSVNILVAPTTTVSAFPTPQDYTTLSEALSLANNLNSFASTLVSVASTAQANDRFYIDEMGRIVKNSSKATKFSFSSLDNARALSQVGKNFGKALSVVGVGIVIGELATDGLNANTTADTVICAIGFLPGVGWVISGVYTVANVAVTAATGKTIPEHVAEKVGDYYYGVEQILRKYFSVQMLLNYYP